MMTHLHYAEDVKFILSSASQKSFNCRDQAWLSTDKLLCYDMTRHDDTQAVVTIHSLCRYACTNIVYQYLDCAVDEDE
jgi:hypothetical protein